MSKFFCNGADAECSCPILCADCKSADWTGGTEIKTNADHIRSMTDEELDRFICSHTDCAGCSFGSAAGCTLSEWLKQPYKEDA